MKHLKTTIKLSVLALACLGAGALALQPSAYAKAEDTIKPEDCLTMVHGASVCVGDNFSGIRWTTKIDTTAVAALVAEYENAEITCGTLVMPTSQLGNDGVLTEEDKGAINIVANVDLEKDVQYFSTINYDNLAESYTGELSTEEALQKAYALELTARSYVKVNNNYYFTDMTGISTSRSARQVALAAELAGDLDKMGAEKADKAAGYYSKDGRYADYEVNTGKAGTKYIDLSALATARQTIKINVDLGIDAYDSRENTGLEVMIGAQRMTSTIIYTPAKPAVEADEEAGIEGSKAEPAQLAFHVPAGTVLPTGEHYVSVFLPNGTIKTIPFICATKALKTADDLKMFNAKGDNYDRTTKVGTDGVNITTYWKPEQEQSGYYVLGADIDANAYTHGSMNAADAYKDPGKYNASTWNGASTYRNRPIGLTGTFNGLGYVIDGMTMGSSREGFFGIVNGGTVKNVAFNDVKTKVKSYAYVLANYLLDATVDNVYIATNQYKSDDKTNNPGFVYGTGSGILANTAYNTTISNSLLRLNKWSSTSTASTFGALFGGTHGNESFTCENVFVYVRNHFQYLVESTTEIDGVATPTYKQTTAQYYTAMVTTHPALSGEIMETVEKDGVQVEEGTGVYTVLGDADGKNTKGLLYLAQNQTLTAPNVSLMAAAYDTKILTGVYYYGQNDTWALDTHDFTAFFASGCWGTNSARGVDWKRL